MSAPRAREPGWGWFVFAAALVVLVWGSPGLGRYLADVDHGWQIAAGRQIVLGRFPYVDFVYHYGPLVGLTSALALAASGSLVGETVVCCLGYAGALLLLHGLARRRVAPLAGWLVPAAALLLLARFYKWYYWLFPLLVLTGLHRALEGARARRWLVFTGLVAGTAGLFRPDLGLVLSALSLALLLCEAVRDRRAPLRSAAALLPALAVAPLLWSGVLIARGGAAGVRSYLGATAAGIRGYPGSYALAPQAFDWGDPLSVRSGLFLAQALYLPTAIACTAIGARAALRARADPDGRDRFALAVGLLGLGLAPQVFVRADAQHLLQALPALLLGAALLLRRGWRPAVRDGGPRWLRPATALYATLLGIAALGVGPAARRDLAFGAPGPLARLRALHAGVSPRAERGLALLVTRLREVTAPDGRVIALPILPQVYFFSERPVSGLLLGYGPGLYDDPGWRRRNLERVERDPPAALVMLEGSLAPGSEFRRSQPELAEFLSRRFRDGRVTAVGSLRLVTPAP